MGVHRDHRGLGYGTAITVAAAAALRELGSSSAVVCTTSSNVGAVATYRSAGFQQLPERRDLCRGALCGLLARGVATQLQNRHQWGISGGRTGGFHDRGP
jgi:ribosomal protein S18 acetylase RimI-like enzyme